jgi:3-hydroxyisobutyrate dehydrogenase-like beta-hydroxyacid dehydrogenase
LEAERFAKMDLAWIGTGIMGVPMARRLLKSGHRVRVFNRTIEKARALAADGAILASNPAEAVEGAAMIFTMLPDTPDVLRVIDQISSALIADQLVIDMSTVSPTASRQIAASLAPRGVAVLDAPVSGGEPGAIEGTLTIMVGGTPEAFALAQPILAILGKRITHMGAAGAGQTTKLANQIAVSLNCVAAAEALLFAGQGGLDPARVLEAIGAGAAASWQLNNLGPKMIAHDNHPGFLVKLLRKDLRLVTEAAKQGGLALPALAMVSSIYNTAAALGHDDDGTQSVVDALERIAKVK